MKKRCMLVWNQSLSTVGYWLEEVCRWFTERKDQKVKSAKVVVTFYLRLKNEFQPFPAKTQASNWLTCLVMVSQSKAWFLGFLAGNGWNSYHNMKNFFPYSIACLGCCCCYYRCCYCYYCCCYYCYCCCCYYG